MSIRRLVALVVAGAAVFSAGCGGGHHRPSVAKAVPTTLPFNEATTTTAVPGSAALTSTGAGANGATATTVVAKGGAAASQTGGPTTTSTTITLPDNYVYAGLHGRNLDDPRPSDCDFKRGQACYLHITGNYGLKASPTASIAVGAYEDGSSTAASSVTLPSMPEGRHAWYVDHFPYAASASAKTVSFVATLVDPTGKELARSSPVTIPISG